MILTAAAHEQVVRDSFDNDSLKLETIKDKRTFKGKQHELHIIDIGPTDHSEHLLVATPEDLQKPLNLAKHLEIKK